MTGPPRLLVMAFNHHQVKTWASDRRIPPQSWTYLQTPMHIMGMDRALVVQLHGWDMLPYRDVKQVLDRIAMVEGITFAPVEDGDWLRPYQLVWKETRR